MQIDRDERPEYFAQLEDLLYGLNYQVWINLYGPFEADAPLEQVLNDKVSRGSIVGGASIVDVAEMRSEVMQQLLNPGDSGSGPLDLALKKERITALAEKLLADAHANDAERVITFWFAKGHPAYPVFWDFAFDIHAAGQRWILMGSSSD